MLNDNEHSIVWHAAMEKKDPHKNANFQKNIKKLLKEGREKINLAHPDVSLICLLSVHSVNTLRTDVK